MIRDWLQLVRASFRDHPEHCIAVHCVAGLGRAPVLVALALIEAGMKYEDAVELIRRFVPTQCRMGTFLLFAGVCNFFYIHYGKRATK